MSNVGVLALQGNFGNHCTILSHLGATTHHVLKPSDLDELSALIIPGGESTSIIKLIQRADLFHAITDFACRRPMFGTCAGAILMAAGVDDFEYPTFGLLDIKIERNAYGRQVASGIKKIEFNGGVLDVAFIRAPRISTVGAQETILADWKGDPVIVRNQYHMVATCHPEFLNNTSVHAYFLEEFVT